VVRPQNFDGSSRRVARFITACKLYIWMRMRGAPVEEQIQWMLLYMQVEATYVWKENILEDLEEGLLEYETVGEFLAEIRKKLRRGDEELVKVAELKRLEQGGKTIEKFVQKSRRAARRSRYERRPLVEELKRGINTMICQRFMESE